MERTHAWRGAGGREGRAVILDTGIQTLARIVGQPVVVVVVAVAVDVVIAVAVDVVVAVRVEHCRAGGWRAAGLEGPGLKESLKGANCKNI